MGLISIYVELIGDKARTEKIGIASFFDWLTHTTDVYDDFIVECEIDLGEIQLVTISNDTKKLPLITANWFIDYTYVINLKTRFEQNFPCYHWIGNEDSFTNSAHIGKYSRNVFYIGFLICPAHII